MAEYPKTGNPPPGWRKRVVGGQETGEWEPIPKDTTEEVTPEKKAAEAAEKKKLQNAPMPKQADYPDIKDFAEAMRKWREQNRSAKDAAGALAAKPQPAK